MKKTLIGIALLSQLLVSCDKDSQINRAANEIYQFRREFILFPANCSDFENDLQNIFHGSYYEYMFEHLEERFPDPRKIKFYMADFNINNKLELYLDYEGQRYEFIFDKDSNKFYIKPFSKNL